MRIEGCNVWSIHVSVSLRSGLHGERGPARFCPGERSVPWTSYIPGRTDRPSLCRILRRWDRRVWWTRGRCQVSELWSQLLVSSTPQTTRKLREMILLLSFCLTGALKENLKVSGREDMLVFSSPEYFSTWNVHSKRECFYNQFQFIFISFFLTDFLLHQVSAQVFFPEASRFTVCR